MDKWVGKVAIVSGVSSGIGAALAEALVGYGVVVVGLARRHERVQKLADRLAKEGKPGKLHAVKADLRKEEEINSAFQWVEVNLGGASILVNNAAIIVPTLIQDGDPNDWRDIVDLNLIGSCISTRLFLKSMEKRNNQQGHIIFVNSTLGHMSEMYATLYTGTKHALAAIASSLRKELAAKGSAIKVTDVSPGVTRTEMADDFINSANLPSVLEAEDVSQVIIDVLSLSPSTQICEVVITSVPSKVFIY